MIRNYNKNNNKSFIIATDYLDWITVGIIAMQ